MRSSTTALALLGSISADIYAREDRFGLAGEDVRVPQLSGDRDVSSDPLPRHRLHPEGAVQRCRAQVLDRQGPGDAEVSGADDRSSEHAVEDRGDEPPVDRAG